MLSSNPLMDIGVPAVLLGPLFMRWPVLLLPILGAAGASVASPEWASILHQYTVPTVLTTVFGYVIMVFAKAVGAAE